ncbi:MAG: hypothetical protein AB7P76_09315 [Candidatus Melainabacteria bacterium]
MAPETLHQPRTLAWGFPKEFGKIVDHAVASGVIDLRLWIGPEPQCTYSRKDFMMPDLSFKHVSPVRCPDEAYQKVRMEMWAYMDMASRWTKMWPFNGFPYNRYDIHDYFNLFHRQLDYYYYLLTHHEIELIVFDRIPHYGTDKILYELAKALGINTIVFFVTIFPDLFFYVYDVKDFGLFSQVPPIHDYQHYPVERKHEKLLPYMALIPHGRYTFATACKDFLKTRDLGVFSKYRRWKEFDENLEQYSTRDFDVTQPFVYFPLHYQPELTTSALGDTYSDQLLALERLSDNLPEGWTILVKENPAQSEFMRGRIFFERLAAIPNTKLVPRNVSTYYLIEHCRFVATVTGTAGYEAITGGKPALVFGRAWYMNFPGVFLFDDIIRKGITYPEVAAHRFSHDDLETALSSLIQKMGRGEICRENYAIIEFDEEINGAKVADSLRKMIAGLYARQTV